MIVAKFGGTSVSTKESVFALCNIVESELKRKPIVVVSALSGVTDSLLSLPTLPKNQARKKIQEIRNLHKSLVESLWKDSQLQDEALKFIHSQLHEVTQLIIKRELDKEFLDRLASFGEIMSSYIVTKALINQGINAEQVSATKIITTDNNFGSAEFLPHSTKANAKKVLNPLMRKKIVPVVTGFIGSTRKGKVTTLGRGGSDYTASIIGFCLDAEEIQIWTDVDGIFTADPRLVKNAKSLAVVSFKEAAELATFGAKVLHPRTISPAIKMGIPVRVLNTLNSKSKGTKIIKESRAAKIIKAISFKRKITLVNIYSTEMFLQKGFLARIFQIFSSNNISIDLVSVSEVSVSVTLDNNGGLLNAVKQLSTFANVTVIEDFGMVSLIGEGVTSSSQTIRKIFDILDKEQILTRMVSLGATDINVSLVIESNNIEKAVKVLHERVVLRQINDKLQNSAIIASK